MGPLDLACNCFKFLFLVILLDTLWILMPEYPVVTVV